MTRQTSSLMGLMIMGTLILSSCGSSETDTTTHIPSPTVQHTSVSTSSGIPIPMAESSTAGTATIEGTHVGSSHDTTIVSSSLS